MEVLAALIPLTLIIVFVVMIARRGLREPSDETANSAHDDGGNSHWQGRKTRGALDYRYH